MLRVREREGKKSKLGRAVMKIKESRYWNGLSLIKRRVNKFLGKRGRRRRRKKEGNIGREAEEKPALFDEPAPHLLTW